MTATLLWWRRFGDPADGPLSVEVHPDQDAAVASAAHLCDSDAGDVLGIELPSGDMLADKDLDDLIDAYWSTALATAVEVTAPTETPQFRVVVSGPLGDGVYATTNEADAERKVFEVQAAGVPFERVTMERVKS